MVRSGLPRPYRERLSGWISGGVAWTAAVLFAVVACCHVYEQVDWRRYFQSVHVFGENCGFAVLPWTGSYDDALAARPALTAMAMPYRGNGKAPKIQQNELLYVACRADATVLRADTGFRWMSLGVVFGDSRAYLNGRLKAEGAGIPFGFPLLTDEISKPAEVVVLSRVDRNGLAGMGTLVPLHITDDYDAQRRINRFLFAVYGEHIVLRLGLAAGLLALFSAFWRFGLRYPDVGWLRTLAAIQVLLEAESYAQQFFWSQGAAFARLEGVLSIWCAVATVLCLTASARLQPWLARATRIAVAAGLCLSVLVIAASPALFSAWKMQRQLPALVAAAGAALLAVAARRALRHCRDDRLRGRLRRIVWLASGTAAVLCLQRWLDAVYGVQLLPFTNILILTVFTALAAGDLVRRQREYFVERAQRLTKETEAAEARLITRVAQMAAHDVRRPFSVLGNAFEVLRTDAAALTPGRIDAMISDLGDASQFVDGLLASLAWIDTPQEGRVQTTAVAPAVHQAIAYARKFAKESLGAVDLGCDVDPALAVQANAITLVRMFYNLIENAAAAMNGRGVIHIHAEAGGETVDITVHNTGTLIPEEARLRLFELGYTSGKREGSGLGLSFVKAAAETFGGGVRCASSQADGTRFTLTLPRATPVQPPLEVPVLSVPQAVAQPDLVIAVVDDDELHLTTLTVLLRHLTVKTYATPEQLLRELAGVDGCRPSAIVLDHRFAGTAWTGVTLAKELRRLAPATHLILSSAEWQQLPPDDLAHFDAVAGKRAAEIERALQMMRNISA